METKALEIPRAYLKYCVIAGYIADFSKISSALAADDGQFDGLAPSLQAGSFLHVLFYFTPSRNPLS